ncbi:L-seryl-tRNA(Sec) kinase isoform X1 [Pelobates fuscus]|uniref:L-seryl-tRNA(Sec) kinase isoform X1 n=1 Tax=Pelobates fuscus TaxID=191477 RepID=UPI002FE4C19E
MCEAARPRRLALCLLCGLPASGKSTLAESLRKRASPHESVVVVVTYDDVITAASFSEGLARQASGISAEPGGEETSLWKQFRHLLLQYIEQLIDAFLNSSGLVQPLCVSEKTWHRFIGCLERQGLILNAASDVKTSSLTLNIPENNSLCLVLDDNFYYQSMRYEVYQLARKYSAGFCQIYLHCPVDCCVMRNRSRACPVSDQTICLMEQKIEKPNAKKNTWEQNSLIIDSSEKDSMQDSKIPDLISQALENPITPVEEDYERKQEQDRAICAANILHQADKIYRRLISETMQTIKGTISVEEMKMLAQELQRAKSKLLEKLRQSMSLRVPCAADMMFLIKEQVDNIVHPYLFKE